MKKKAKIIISAITVLTLVLSINLTCFAAETQAPGTDSSSTYITDRATLDQYVSDHGMQIPDGKTLEALKITVVNDPTLVAKANSIAAQTQMSNNSINSIGAMTLTNRVYAGAFYYGDQPYLTDTIQGPMATGPNIKFTNSTTAGFSGEFGVTAEIINVSFGVNFSTTYSVERTFQFDPIPAGKYLQYNAFVNYSVYNFDVYNYGIYSGTSKYWIPVGIVITQALIG